jgi:hypothetical protein
MDNQLIDEALRLYNYLRLYAYKRITNSDARARLDKMVLMAFYRHERRIKIKQLHKLYETYKNSPQCFTKPIHRFFA